MQWCGCCISLYIWTPPSVTPPAIMVSSVMRQGTNHSHQPGDGACTGDGLPSWPYKHYLCSGECAQLYSSEGILYVVLNTLSEYKFTLLCIFTAYFSIYYEIQDTDCLTVSLKTEKLCTMRLKLDWIISQSNSHNQSDWWLIDLNYCDGWWCNCTTLFWPLFWIISAVPPL